MSSTQIAKLILKGVNVGTNHIPDSWFEAIPGGYFKAKDKVEKKVANRDRREKSQSRWHRAHRHGRKTSSETDYSDTESDNYRYSSDDFYLSDEERYVGGGGSEKGRMRGGSWDRDHGNRRQRATSMPPSPPPTGPPQPGYFGQRPFQQMPPYNNGPRPYNPAEYASIPADGTTIRDPQAHRASRGDAQSMYSTSSWVDNQASRNMHQPAGAVLPPPTQSTTPPYNTPPYDYPVQDHHRGRSITGYIAPPSSARYQPQYSNALTRSASARDSRWDHHRGSSRSKRNNGRRPRSTSPKRAEANNVYVVKRNKRGKYGTPALAAVTGGLVASEVGGAGGIGTLAGAAIGGLAMHVLDKRSRSKSKSREKSEIEAAAHKVAADAADSEYENEQNCTERQREMRRHRRREERGRTRERRSYSDGYQSP